MEQQSAAKPRQETHYELGIAYQASKMYTEAIAEFQKAIALDPDFIAAHTNLGEIYLETGRLDDAENAANAALRIDANSQPARQLLEDIRQARPPTPNETEPTRSASSTSSDVSDVRKDLERGLVFLNNGQYPQAAAAFKRVLKTETDSIEAHYGLGQAYLEVGAFGDATTATEEVLKRNPSHHHARELLQIIKFAKNRERNRERRKKVLSYAAILSVIAVCIFIAIRLGVIPPIQPIPPIILIEASLEEPSRNGVLDAGEDARLRLTISNKGGTTRNIRIKFDPAFITGIEYKQPDIISKLGRNGKEDIAVEMTVSDHARTRTQSLKIDVLDKDGMLLASKNFSLKIQGVRRR